METITFLVSLPDEDDQVKGIFSTDADIAVRDLPINLLRENLNKVCQGMASMLSDVKKVGNFRLKEVTIQVEVTAEGGIELVGTAKLGGKGAITLTFSE
jgi:autotransporter translocation and assembly factor TamB